MKQNTFLRIWQFIITFIAMVSGFALVLSFFSYDKLSPILNTFAPDGSVELFTWELWEGASGVLKLLSGVSLFGCTILIVYWRVVEQFIFKLSTSISQLIVLVKTDARFFMQECLGAIYPLQERYLMLALVVIAFVPRLANLFIPMEFDEAYLYNAFASHSFWHVVSDYDVPNNHVFLTIIVHFIVKMFGNHLWMMRFPSFLAGVLAVPVAYYVSRRLYGFGTGVVSGIFVSLFPILIKYSVLVRGYAFVSLFTLLIIGLGDYVRLSKNRFVWLLIALISALGLYTVPLMLFPVGAVYLWLLLSMIGRDMSSYDSWIDFLKHLAVSCVCMVLVTTFLYLPIILNRSNNLFGNIFIAPLNPNVYPYVIWSRLQETWVDWTQLIPVWIVILGVLGLGASFLFNKTGQTHKVPLQIAFLIWIAAYCLWKRPDMESRMWLFLAAPLLIWSAAGLVEFLRLFIPASGDWHPEKVFVSATLITGLMFVVVLIPSIPERWAQRGSVENAVLFLRDNLQDGDIITTSRNFRPLLQYYSGIYDVPLKDFQHVQHFERAYVLVRSVDWSPESGDTLEAIAPRDEKDSLLIDLSSSTLIQQYEDLALYLSYPIP